jgi:hypothetical protein
MKNPIGLLVACGVLIVLGGLVWWTGKHPSKPETTTPATPKILALGEDQIEGIRIAKLGSEPIQLKKNQDKWVLAAPAQFDADQDTVKALVSSLATFNGERLIDENPTDLGSFGLKEPAVEIEVAVKGGTVNKLQFGTDTPSGTATYVKLAAAPKVYTVLSSSKSTFDKSVSDLRDKRVLTFNQDKLTGLTVTAKGPAFEFGRNAQNEWQIVKPGPYRADTLQVDDLIRKLKDAKIDLGAAGTDDPKKAAAEFTSGAAIATVAVRDSGAPQTITIHQAKDKTYYVRSSVVEGTYKLSGDLGDGLKDKDADSFRNKKLFDFGFNDPTKVEIDGKAYQKSGDKWNGPTGSVDPSTIQTMIDKLRDFSASKFTEKPSGAPALSLVVTSGDKNKVEKVSVTKAGDAYNAQREGESSVYVVESKTFDDLQKAIQGIKPAPPEKKK